MKQLDLHLDTQERNHRFAHHDIKVEMVPYQHLRMLQRTYFEQKAAIAVDRHLTDDGKKAATDKAKATRDAAMEEWNTQRLKNFDAHLLEQRAALFADTTVPEPKHVEVMASQLLKHAPSDIAIFYNSATDAERRVMEAASAFVGRVPMITPNGKEWKTLLDPEAVNEAILARAEATNPIAAQRVRELAELRAMQVTAARVALSEI